ncbi:hypothetical protein CSC2_37560 [Clostridium zeae]|uniref:Hydrolase n=1 Tax=Clostridium zeae TaxID=2759022 RepID=A0ABQ1EEN0_9CLOT|nr:hypothetical protein CSC2_37560 [Clostridium zeae]
MQSLVLLLIIIVLIIILILASIKHLKNKCNLKPVTINVFRVSIVSILVGLVILGLWSSGLRFTPLQASKANSFIEVDSKFLKEIKIDNNFLHIYYNPKEKLYRTTFTKHVGFLFESKSSTYYYPHEEDMVATLGGSNIETKEGYESVLYIASKDPQVTEFEVLDSDGNYISRQPANSGDSVTIQYKYPSSENTANYKVLALNKDLDVVYYYGYPINSNKMSIDDYKWHEMKNEKLDSKFAAKIKSGNLVTNYKIDTVLSDIDNLGLNTLNIPVVIAIKDLSSSDMSIDKNSEEQAIKLIKKLQGKNINIILEPYPWIANGSKVETEWKPNNINDFFNNWKIKVLKPLIDDIAVPYHVESFNIGTSFNNIENYEDQFCEMIDFVKSNYKGLVTYRTSWWVTTNWNDPSTKKIEDNLKAAYNKKLNNKLFSKLDFISIASYFELTDKDTNTVDNLVRALQSTQRYNRKQNVKQEIKSFNTKYNKPIFFGELGFPPKDKASIEPWNPYLTYKWKDKEQANCFEAYKTVFENEPWNLGFSIFAIGSKESDNNYYPSDDTMEIIKGWYSK